MTKYLNLKKRIKRNEGFRNFAYLDSLGFHSIGYGHLVKVNEKHLLIGRFSKKLLLNFFNSDFNKALKDYEKIYKKQKHQQHTKEVLIEMIFQLGIKKQIKFIKMNKHINNNCLFMAALEMKNSLWYTQTPKRVDKLINILLKEINDK